MLPSVSLNDHINDQDFRLLTNYRSSSDIFATSSYNDVRVWHASTGKELLRLSTPNITCHSVIFTPNGKGIITGIQYHQ